MASDTSRRPLKSRGTPWARKSAQLLQRAGVKPNAISVFSVVFALAGAACFWLAGGAVPLHRALWIAGGVAGIMGRLLCNLFDGMVAVEGGMKTPAGEIYNDLPDRLSDLALFVAIGYGVGMPELGWAAGSVAVLTAYIRYLGAGCGVGHSFIGPMAKQQRMATVIGASLGSIALEPFVLPAGILFKIALGLVILGGVITCFRRVNRIATLLQEAAG